MAVPDRSPDSVREVASALIDAHAASPSLRVGQIILNTIASEFPDNPEERLYAVENRTLAELIRKHTVKRPTT